MPAYTFLVSTDQVNNRRNNVTHVHKLSEHTHTVWNEGCGWRKAIDQKIDRPEVIPKYGRKKDRPLIMISIIMSIIIVNILSMVFPQKNIYK